MRNGDYDTSFFVNEADFDEGYIEFDTRRMSEFRMSYGFQTAGIWGHRESHDYGRTPETWLINIRPIRIMPAGLVRLTFICEVRNDDV